MPRKQRVQSVIRFQGVRMRFIFIIVCFSMTVACGKIASESPSGVIDDLDRSIMMDDAQSVRRIIDNNSHYLNSIIGDQYNEKPIHVAAYYGRVEISRYLILRGADVNAEYDGGYKTALLTAIWKGHEQLAIALVELGADVKVRSRAGLSVCELSRRKNMTNLMKMIPDCI